MLLSVAFLTHTVTEYDDGAEMCDDDNDSISFSLNGGKRDRSVGILEPGPMYSKRAPTFPRTASSTRDPERSCTSPTDVDIMLARLSITTIPSTSYCAAAAVLSSSPPPPPSPSLPLLDQ